MLGNNHSSSQGVVQIRHIANDKDEQGFNKNSVINCSVSKQTMLSDGAHSCFRNDQINPLQENHCDEKGRLRVLNRLSGVADWILDTFMLHKC